MRKVFFTTEFLQKRITERPPEYYSEIEPAILEKTDTGIFIDMEHPAFLAAKAKYSNISETSTAPVDTNSIYQKRPTPTIEQVKTLSKAALTGKYVPLNVVQERQAICSTCEFKRNDGKSDWCGICGCKVSSEDKKITNLAAYEEKLPEWGCKHPLRNKGKGWKS